MFQVPVPRFWTGALMKLSRLASSLTLEVIAIQEISRRGIRPIAREVDQLPLALIIGHGIDLGQAGIFFLQQEMGFPGRTSWL